ncbi:hypothetical protein GCM10009560_40680 [Nonomuraea longicatena]|uniref:Uncharacterized protein n=1 Tax=Nonomuraea longicatena TaxID=83682 RepID=A0ABN1PVN5_9ACTN
MSGEEPVKPPPVAVPVVTPEPPPPPVREPRPEPTPPPPVPKPTPTPQGKARLSASIDALGALVRDHPGIVGLRLRNTGKGPSEELSATVALPPGVTLLSGARRGSALALVKPVGSVDGWSCRAQSGGATCVRRPLAARASTAVFLRVRVDASAPEGAGPAVHVNSGGVRLRAAATVGVQAEGAPARFATDGKVLVRSIGNTLLSCPQARDGCEEARERRGGRRDNDLWPMRRVDEDDVARTTASSGARLDLPPGSQIVWAGLYWSAGTPKGGPIEFRPPGRKKYSLIQPTQVTVRPLPAGSGYQAFADVTALVSAGDRKGMWWAADAPVKQGVSQHAGWSLMVIATDPGQPYSQVVVLDTATQVGGEDDEPGRVDLPLGGLSPAAAPARVDLVTWEGDADLRGDRVLVGGTPLVPAAGDRRVDNAFDGSANGADKLTFGVDVDTFSGELGDRPRLSIVTRRDAVLFGVVAVSVRTRS